MSEKQGILKRLEYYADCIDKGIHVTGSQLKRLVLDIREQGVAENPVGWGPSYPQPWMVGCEGDDGLIRTHPEAETCDVCAPQSPAEAQPVGVEGFRDWVIEQMPAGTVIDNPELWAERLARAYELNVPPPSAPVGVDTIRDGRAIVDEFLQCASIGRPHGKLIAQAKDWLADAEAALTKQPAAAGEEIMVNAAHDVYTLPLQPSGLSSGPRFVVHVPAPEQPAAVDGAIAGWSLRHERGMIRVIGPDGRSYATIDPDLAGQQGGGDGNP